MAFDAGEDEKGLYLVMEFVDGRDLSCEVAQTGPLSIADATDCTLQAARGLGLRPRARNRPPRRQTGQPAAR